MKSEMKTELTLTSDLFRSLRIKTGLSIGKMRNVAHVWLKVRTRISEIRTRYRKYFRRIQHSMTLSQESWEHGNWIDFMEESKQALKIWGLTSILSELMRITGQKAFGIRDWELSCQLLESYLIDFLKQSQ